MINLLLAILVFGLVNCQDFSVSGEHDQTIFRASNSSETRYLLYEVNPGEGFNLRRDVYIRMANLVKLMNDEGAKQWTLVLPPWGRIYHWKSDIYQRQVSWNRFFDIESLNRHVPVMELKDWMKVVGEPPLVDELYYLQRYEEGWVGGKWTERCDIKPCIEYNGYILDEKSKTYRGWFWEYIEMTAKTFECLSVQAEIRTFTKFLQEQTEGHSVMLHRGETLIHGMLSEWSKEWWTARRSMRFSPSLLRIADEFRQENLDSNDEADKTVVNPNWTQQQKALGEALGGPYLAVHLRRGDFVRSRKEEVPSLKNAASQIQLLLKELHLNKVYVASDAPQEEFNALSSYLGDYEVYRYRPDSRQGLEELGDGGVAIIEQWICAHARHFAGTSSSTYSFRIHEERSLLGFAPDSTFNRLCGDSEDEEKCKSHQPGRWFPKYS